MIGILSSASMIEGERAFPFFGSEKTAFAAIKQTFSFPTRLAGRFFPIEQYPEIYEGAASGSKR